MTRFGIFEAKNKLSELLDRVERGEKVIITRNGNPIAKIEAVTPVRNVEAAQDAGRRLRENAVRHGGKFDWAEWTAYRDEGRK